MKSRVFFNWLSKNKLSIDLGKTKFLLFHKKKWLPPAFDNYFISIAEAHSVNTRISRYGYAMPSAKTNFRLKSPSYISLSLWNNLDHNNCNNLSLRKFKKYLTDKYISDY